MASVTVIQGSRGCKPTHSTKWQSLWDFSVRWKATKDGLLQSPPRPKIQTWYWPLHEVRDLYVQHRRVSQASRTDKTIIVWQLTRDDDSYGYPKRILQGHNHFVSDVVISSDGQFALSSSWDHTLRLWDLNTGLTTRRFVGHTSDVLSVSFSADNRQIVSGSRDKSIKLWNTLGECKYDIKEEGHTEWFADSVLMGVIIYHLP